MLFENSFFRFCDKNVPKKYFFDYRKFSSFEAFGGYFQNVDISLHSNVKNVDILKVAWKTFFQNTWLLPSLRAVIKCRFESFDRVSNINTRSIYWPSTRPSCQSVSCTFNPGPTKRCNRKLASPECIRSKYKIRVAIRQITKNCNLQERNLKYKNWKIFKNYM